MKSSLVSRVFAGVVSAGAFSLAACATTPAGSTAAAGDSAATLSGPAATSTPNGAAVQRGASDLFYDAANAAVASASNQSEIQPSQVALERAQSQAVKDFARRMVDEHTALEQKQQAMLASKGVTPQDNALSLQLKRNLPLTLEMLRAKSGMEFDKAYVLQQIQSHQTTLHALDTSLIPSTQDRDMKAMLQSEVRPRVAAHLQEVMRMHDAMLRGA